jgi:hypothetical protein
VQPLHHDDRRLLFDFEMNLPGLCDARGRIADRIDEDGRLRALRFGAQGRIG